MSDSENDDDYNPSQNDEKEYSREMRQRQSLENYSVMENLHKRYLQAFVNIVLKFRMKAKNGTTEGKYFDGND